MAMEGLGSEVGGHRTGAQLGAWLSLGQAKSKTCIPRAGETANPILPAAESPWPGAERSTSHCQSHLQGQIQRLQERDPDPPFSLPELKPKECPCPASQPHFETEQDVFLIKDTWEAFALRSFPGLSLILTVNLQKGSSMLLTILQCQHVHVAVCPAWSLSVPHKCSAPFPSISFLRRNGLTLSLPHWGESFSTHALRDKCDDFTGDANSGERSTPHTYLWPKEPGTLWMVSSSAFTVRLKQTRPGSERQNNINPRHLTWVYILLNVVSECLGPIWRPEAKHLIHSSLCSLREERAATVS